MLLHFNLFAGMHAVLKKIFFCHSYKMLVFMGLFIVPLLQLWTYIWPFCSPDKYIIQL